jgi:hypothetical protein
MENKSHPCRPRSSTLYHGHEDDRCERIHLMVASMHMPQTHERVPLEV